MHPLYNAVCGFLAVIATSASLVAATPNPTKKPADSKNAELAFEEHKVKKGETLWGIAQKHSTSVGEIMDCNRLPNETVRDGMTLKIPRRKKNIPIKLNPSREVESIKEVATPSKPAAKSSIPAGAIIHAVAENDTFYSIGKKYGLSTESIVTANPSVKPEQLREGMKIVVPKPPPSKTRDSAPKIEGKKDRTSMATTPAPTVTSNKNPPNTVGETAKKTSPAPASSTDSKKAAPASKPVVVSSNPVMTEPDETKPKTAVADGVIRSYIVSAGEDESTISEAFGITKKQLLEYNRLSSSTKLKPGDEIMIPRAAK